ncbi:MAG: ZIP family metal transporter [Clostridium sp.]|uniref:ZIP family metal transporter n=1 Tax=Clostridium sp. TaxID=1506 RepID=UPI002911DD84|nr:ZIP family metal transporter [Clostridium sp.]MDU7336602.1 ZIP family metal transporter [Clostridium sp.]
MNSVSWLTFGLAFPFFMTTLGAALVFFFRGTIHENVQKALLGFASGVMIAASVWSLLIPAIEQAEQQGQVGWIPAAGGFVLGGLFLLALDNVLPHLHLGESQPEGVSSSWKRTTLLFLAVTLHNIPEGMAVGLSFALALQSGEQGALSAAVVLAIGMGIQNFPEGAAISLPLRKEGLSVSKAFLGGMLSGAVEPVFAVITILLASHVLSFMPWLLAFAAGAMLYVVVEELIPEASRGEHSNVGTLGVMGGFVLMMILDVALG